MNQLELITAVFREYGIVQERVDAIFKKHLPDDLPAAQFKLLNHLIYTTNKNETASDIAQNSHVSLSAMSQVIKHLRVKGYVELQAQKEDIRKKMILITELGRNAHTEALLGIDIDIQGFSEKFSLPELKKLYALSHQFRCEFEGHYKI
jgi:DNA-binding MarR family transcriptional regulator